MSNKVVAFIVFSSTLAIAAGCDVADRGDPADRAASSGVELNGVSLASRPFQGPETAKVTIVELMDYECSFCRRVEPTLKRILDAHPGDVRVVVINNPLPKHSTGELSARAAKAASKQGKFWEMHTRLLEVPAIDRESIQAEAKAIGLDLSQFDADLASEKTGAEVEADLAVAQKLDVRGAPTFFINGRRVVGAQPFEELDAIVNGMLATPAGLEAKNVVEETSKADDGECSPPAR